MNFIFPYDMIKKGSRVALYGFGNVGKDFFEQMLFFDYCECVLCVDQSFESYERIERPFGRIGELEKDEYDYIVIAIVNKKIAFEVIDSIKKYVKDLNKIIWHPYYTIKTIWPNNKRLYLENPEFYMDITKKYRIANSIYGGGQFYQSFSSIGIEGTRKIQERLNIYHIDRFLKKTDRVLDIGCNCGFLDIQLSQYVDSVKGIDIESQFIDIANLTKEYVNCGNVFFEVTDFQKEYETNSNVYDVVFALAVYTNVFETGVKEQQFVDEIIGLLKSGGILFFESHNLINDRERFNRLCALFQDSGLSMEMRENYYSDFDRDIVVLRKN